MLLLNRLLCVWYLYRFRGLLNSHVESHSVTVSPTNLLTFYAVCEQEEGCAEDLEYSWKMSRKGLSDAYIELMDFTEYVNGKDTANHTHSQLAPFRHWTDVRHGGQCWCQFIMILHPLFFARPAFLKIYTIFSQHTLVRCFKPRLGSTFMIGDAAKVCIKSPLIVVSFIYTTRAYPPSTH